MARILLCSSAVRVHDSQAYRKMAVARELISRTLELRKMLLSFRNGLNLDNAAVVKHRNIPPPKKKKKLQKTDLVLERIRAHLFDSNMTKFEQLSTKTQNWKPTAFLRLRFQQHLKDVTSTNDFLWPRTKSKTKTKKKKKRLVESDWHKQINKWNWLIIRC